MKPTFHFIYLCVPCDFGFIVNDLNFPCFFPHGWHPLLLVVDSILDLVMFLTEMIGYCLLEVK